MSTYSCDKCSKTFKQKGDLTKHLNKKAPCITIEKMQDIVAANSSTNDAKTNLRNVFKYCLDILRNNEHIIGDKALYTLSQLLCFKLLEPRFENEINLTDDNNYIMDGIEIDEGSKNRLIKLAKFSEFIKLENINLQKDLNDLFECIFARHEKIKCVFTTSGIKQNETLKKLLDKINTIDTKNIDIDILGDAYEEIIKDVMVGRTLGQHFTPPKIKKIGIDDLKPEISADGTIKSFDDPAMGTGGMLISILRRIIKQAAEKNINIDWDNIRRNITGREAEPDTYKLACANLLITTGHLINIECGDSIRKPAETKCDNILSNPPFGIDGLDYKLLTDNKRDIIFPIVSGNAVSLFMQLIIWRLNIEGRAAVVLPNGQELSGAKEFVYLREYLLRTCDLKKITYFPSGMFTHTSIQTCMAFFVKKVECNTALKTEVKVSKTSGREMDRNYIFADKFATEKVEFYEYNPETDQSYLLAAADIDKIAANGFKLDYKIYLPVETPIAYSDDVAIKTLGEVCEFLPKSKRQASYGKPEGKYPFFKSSMKVDTFVDEPDFKQEAIIIGTGGNANIKYCSEFSCSTDNYVISINSPNLVKYVYYYLLNNIQLMENEFHGVAIKHISKDGILNIKIPIPSLEKQKLIVEYGDFIESSNKTSADKISELKDLNKWHFKLLPAIPGNEIKTLGELCDYKIGATPRRDVLSYYGGTNLWVSVSELNGGYISDTKEKITDSGVNNSSVKLYKKDTVLFSFKLSIGKTAIAGADLYSNEAIAGINTKNEEIIINKYIYYFLSSNDYTNKGYGIFSKGSMNKESLGAIKIEFPKLEKQKIIAEQCEHNDILIGALEDGIQTNNENFKNYMLDILQSNNV